MRDSFQVWLYARFGFCEVGNHNKNIFTNLIITAWKQQPSVGVDQDLDNALWHKQILVEDVVILFKNIQI